MASSSAFVLLCNLNSVSMEKRNKRLKLSSTANLTCSDEGLDDFTNNCCNKLTADSFSTEISMIK